MSYTKTVWTAGDTVTSVKLNKIEQGVYDAVNDGGVFYINIVENYDSNNDTVTTTLSSNVTGQNILDAIDAGKSVLVKIQEATDDVIQLGLRVAPLISHFIQDGKYAFGFEGGSINILLGATSLSANLENITDYNDSGIAV